MTDIYFCRHGEAEGNLYRRCHGQYNSLLTPNGEAQARAAAKVFAAKKLDAVYCSDLYRARRTAELAAGKKHTPIALPEWREEYLGCWEDMTWHEIERQYPEEYHTFCWEPWRFAPSHAESVAACADRLFKAFLRAAAKHEGGAVLVVSHGMALRALLTLLHNKPLTEMQSMRHMDNTAISHVRWDGSRSEVIAYADNSHLGALSTLARQNWWRSQGNVECTLRFAPVSRPRDDAILALFETEAVFGFPQAWLAYDHETPAGLLALETPISRRETAGRIAVLRLLPAYTGRGLEAQLLGAAVSHCRGKGCKALTVRVTGEDAQALAFYKKMGFLRRPDKAGGFLLRKSIAIASVPMGAP